MKSWENLGRLIASMAVVAGVGFDFQSRAVAALPPSFSVKVLAPFGANAGDAYPMWMNDEGQIVGYVQNGSETKGFFYEPGLNGATGNSYAVPVPKGDKVAAFNALNDQEVAAGYVCTDPNCHRFLPYAAQIKGSLAKLIPLKALASKGTMSLGSAFAINASGTITGFEVASGKNLWPGVEERRKRLHAPLVHARSLVLAEVIRLRRRYGN